MIRVGFLYTHLALNGSLALDLFETENGLTINEINHTMEFSNSITITSMNIPQRMVKHVLGQVMTKV
jgi:[lysine-biosynthesis-protein LysW]--L-2-aminoadipate ligase